MQASSTDDNVQRQTASALCTLAAGQGMPTRQPSPGNAKAWQARQSDQGPTLVRASFSAHRKALQEQD